MSIFVKILLLIGLATLAFVGKPDDPSEQPTVAPMSCCGPPPSCGEPPCCEGAECKG